MKSRYWHKISTSIRQYWAASHFKQRCCKPKIVFAILAVILVIVLVMMNRNKIFTLNVITEIATFTVTDPVLSEWKVGKPRLIDDPFTTDQQGRLLGENATLILETGTHVSIQRHGVEVVRIRLSRQNQQSVGRIQDTDGNDIKLGDWAVFLVDTDSKPLVLPFRGTLIAGEDVTIDVDSILLSGAVSVIEEQLLGETHYVAGVEKLDPGDRVQLFSNDGTKTDVPTTVDGFVRAESRGGFSGPVNALSLVAHGQADYVRVERLGSAGYVIHAPRWARFLHDPLLAAATAIITLLVLLFEFTSKCIELVRNEPKRNHGTEVIFKHHRDNDDGI